MTVRCGNCGKEISAGAGNQTAKYGFICYNCSSALNIQLCSVCGQRFPFSEMKEHFGEFFCGDDYRGRMAQIESYKPKPQPKGPMISGSAGIRMRRTRAARAKVPYESLASEIRSMAKPVQKGIQKEISENKESERELSKESEKAEVSEMLKELHKGKDSPKKTDNEEISQTLKRLKGQDKDKKE